MIITVKASSIEAPITSPVTPPRRRTHQCTSNVTTMTAATADTTPAA